MCTTHLGSQNYTGKISSTYGRNPHLLPSRNTSFSPALLVITRETRNKFYCYPMNVGFTSARLTSYHRTAHGDYEPKRFEGKLCVA